MTAPGPTRRVLMLATTTGYQTRMFSEAATRLGVELLYATDRCDQLDDPWRDHAIPVRYHDGARSIDALLAALQNKPIDGVIALGDRPTVMAAHLARVLGLPGHPPEAAVAARDKRLTRDRFAAAGLPTPGYVTVPMSTDPRTLLDRITLPVVIKPTVLSASRGVIRADDPVAFVSAYERLRRLLLTPDVRELRDPEADVIQIEEYVPGVEFAVEAVMEHGRMRTLAIFDKPDPLVGPFFEETIYVAPSRASEQRQMAIEHAVADAAGALGLRHGPIHAECRVNDAGVFVLEVAARPIGGLCARTLQFEQEDRDERIGLEELLMRHALGESTQGWRREAAAAAVMMIPIPRSGVFRHASGVEAAVEVPGVESVEITAKPDQQLRALPEGASYLGFIFARTASPAEAEKAVRDAHARLRFTIDPLLSLATNDE